MDISNAISINPNYLQDDSSFSFLLDDFSRPQTAFSVARRLRSDYGGSAMRVRRSNDDAEMDIGYIDNELDEGALLGFVGAKENGYITTLYDNGQAGINWSQSTPAFQPRIVNSGVVEKENGRPCANQMGGFGVGFITANFPSVSTATLFYVNGYVDTGATCFTLVAQFTSYFLGLIATSANNSYGGTSSDPDIFSNGTQIGQTRTDIKTAMADKQTITSYTNLLLPNWTRYSTMRLNSIRGADTIQEIVVYDTDMSSDRSGIEANINNFYEIY